ncbi:hypothetical protein GP486_006650, partial [Trichoglossum hirsutum]
LAIQLETNMKLSFKSNAKGKQQGDDSSLERFKKSDKDKKDKKSWGRSKDKHSKQKGSKKDDTTKQTEHNKCFKEDLCFKYSKSGHLAKACLEKGKDKQRSESKPPVESLTLEAIVIAMSHLGSSLRATISFRADNSMWIGVRALIDLRAELNFMSQMLVKEVAWLEPNRTTNAVQLLDGQMVSVYGVYNITFRITNN